MGTLHIPINRIGGDLELTIEHEEYEIVDVQSRSLMYRGYENMLKGRGAMDGLVLTPRISGHTGTSHLLAAVKALDMICEAALPVNAILVRNIALMAELIQSDIRHFCFCFMQDFTNPHYADQSFYDEAVQRYTPLRGTTLVDVINHSKKILEIVAILGGQWPSSSFMVPGGIATRPTHSDIFTCDYILNTFTSWYQQRVLGCRLERWLEVESIGDLDLWLNEHADHRDSELGFFLRNGRTVQLDTLGAGHNNFISAGLFDMPPETQATPRNASSTLLTSGVLVQGARDTFQQRHITEHVTFSRFEDYPYGNHPQDGMTIPYTATTHEKKYSWIKAPRYDNAPAEAGPLADFLIDGHPLLTELYTQQGATVFTRQLARIIRTAEILPVMKAWLSEIDAKAPYYQPVRSIGSGQGYGLTGATGHWIQTQKGKINRYQIISPTTWNGSPRDYNEVRGPWEEALIGTRISDPGNPLEIGHIIRSFDPCLACAVH